MLICFGTGLEHLWSDFCVCFDGGDQAALTGPDTGTTAAPGVKIAPWNLLQVSKQLISRLIMA